jgi:hypothetical protein
MPSPRPGRRRPGRPQGDVSWSTPLKQDYALGIVVRYLPSLRHEIEDGKIDHIRALIGQYFSVVDNVLPSVAIHA